jgi:hypothetical protein
MSYKSLNPYLNYDFMSNLDLSNSLGPRSQFMSIYSN